MTCGVALLASAVYVHALLLRNRPAARDVPEGGSVLTAGLVELCRTLRATWSDRPQLMRFLVGYMFADAGMSAFSSVAGTYVIVQLEGTGDQVGRKM